MKPGSVAKTAATVATGLYTVGLHLAGVRLTGGAKSLLSYVPSVVVVLILIADKWAWRWPLVHRLTGHPYLAGTWRLKLRPSTDSHIPACGNRGPIDAFLVVEQTWFGIHLTQVTKESRSTSLGASFRKADHSGQHQLLYTYVNVPLQHHQPRSTQHDGACSFMMIGRDPEAVDAFYFTNRLTRGDISAVRLDRKSDQINYESLVARHGAS